MNNTQSRNNVPNKNFFSNLNRTNIRQNAYAASNNTLGVSQCAKSNRRASCRCCNKVAQQKPSYSHIHIDENNQEYAHTHDGGNKQHSHANMVSDASASPCNSSKGYFIKNKVGSAWSDTSICCPNSSWISYDKNGYDKGGCTDSNGVCYIDTDAPNGCLGHGRFTDCSNTGGACDCSCSESEGCRESYAISNPPYGDCSNQPTQDMKNECFPHCYPNFGGCIGPLTAVVKAYNTKCANGALATAKAWIRACDTYQSPGKSGNPIDPRCLEHPKDCSNGILPYDKTFCQKRCPVAVALAHKESQYCPTAISADWNKQVSGARRLPPPFSDNKGLTYHGGYGLWQLDGTNQNVQKLFVEQLEASGTPGCETSFCKSCTEKDDGSGCWYKEGFYDDRSGVPVWKYVAGFLTPARQKVFSEGIGRTLLTPQKQAEWALYQTTSSFGLGKPTVKLPGCDWSMLRTCAKSGEGTPETWNESDPNPDGNPKKIAATTGVEVCKQAMNDINNMKPDKDWFLYEHCEGVTGKGDTCLHYNKNSEQE